MNIQLKLTPELEDFYSNYGYKIWANGTEYVSAPRQWYKKNEDGLFELIPIEEYTDFIMECEVDYSEKIIQQILKNAE